MADLALEMVRHALDAFVTRDSQVARQVCDQDLTVDALNREIIDELLVTMKRSPELLDAPLLLFSVSRHIERIADHATNIAEHVVYLVDGEIIRHRAEFWAR